MNPHERQTIDDLFDKLREVEQQSGPREPMAEAHIRSRVQQQPGAPYYMAQTILMQDQALQTAQARIAELEDEVARRPVGGGFLSGLFGGSPALLVELKAAGMKHNVLGVPRLCQFFAPPRSRSGSKRQACPKMRSLPTGSQLSDCFLSTKSAGEP